jgi:hypothetical protein
MSQVPLNVIGLVCVLAGSLMLMLSLAWYTLRLGISPMPSSGNAGRAIERIARAGRPCSIVYELGSGWGGLARRLARSLSASHVRGFELSSIPYGWSSLVNRLRRHANLEISRADFFGASLHDADIVVCYLYTGAMARLKEKFECELRPGTMVISNTFAVPGWAPAEVVRLNDWYRTPVYVYRTVEKIKT